MSRYVPRSAVVAELRNGLSNAAIARALKCDRHRVGAIRKELGLPNVVQHTLTTLDKWRALTKPAQDGHLEWTGERVNASRTPVMRHRGDCYSPAAIAFEIQYGRAPQGYAIADCGHEHCVAPGHVQDQAGRQAKRQELRRAKGLKGHPDSCRYGHDLAVHGRLEQDGRPYCEACKRHGKTAGPLAPRPGRPTRHESLAETFHANTTPTSDGHLQWTGPGTRYVHHGDQRIPASRVSFELHHGRPPVGRALTTCDMSGCIAGAHLADRRMRDANRRADAAFEAIFRLAS